MEQFRQALQQVSYHPTHFPSTSTYLFAHSTKNFAGFDCPKADIIPCSHIALNIILIFSVYILFIKDSELVLEDGNMLFEGKNYLYDFILYFMGLIVIFAYI